MSSRRGSEAVAWGNRQINNPVEDFYQECLRFARFCFGDVPSATWNRPNSAKEAYLDTLHRHGPTVPAPVGVPGWYSGGDFGHVVLLIGDGTCLSNDIRRKGKIDRVPVNEITRRWGFKYLGWTEDINGVRVYTPPKPADPPARLELAIVDAWDNVVAHGRPGQPISAAVGAGSFVPSTQVEVPFRGVWRYVR